MTTGDDLKERKDETYLRWQDLALSQLGYTINLILTLAGAALAFGMNTIVKAVADASATKNQATSPLLIAAPNSLQASMFMFGLCMVCAVLANLTRTYDYGASRAIARERSRQRPDNERIERLRNIAACLGSCTRAFFAVEAVHVHCRNCLRDLGHLENILRRYPTTCSLGLANTPIALVVVGESPSTANPEGWLETPLGRNDSSVIGELACYLWYLTQFLRSVRPNPPDFPRSVRSKEGETYLIFLV